MKLNQIINLEMKLKIVANSFDDLSSVTLLIYHFSSIMVYHRFW